MPTGISYVDETLNPVVGCTKCSPGCLNCYAEKMAYRLACMGQKRYREVISTDGGVWNNKVFCDEKTLDIPLHWRKSRRILVPSMGDLFHPKVPFEFIDEVFAVGALCPQHTLLILTKRIERMAEYMPNRDWGEACNRILHKNMYLQNEIVPPLPNVHLGATICTQKEADEKIPLLLQIPAAHRWISAEPLLGELSFRWQPYAHQATGETYRQYLERNGSTNEYEALRKIGGLVVGCESGPNPKRRPCKLEHIRSIVQQCKAAGVGCFVKQIEMWGIDKKNKLFETKMKAKLYFGEVGFKQDKILSTKVKKIVTHDIEKFPKDLQIREVF